MASRRDPGEAALLAELALLYRDADALFAGVSCEASTACCRFKSNGREPYVTSIEALAVERAIARRGGALSPKRRALPIAKDEGTCPLLDATSRCSIYEHRPLGCRTFFCDRARGGALPPRARLAEFVRRVQDIATRHVSGGDLSRPLTRLAILR